ncbi:MAG: formamidase, partial [Cyanobacteria bacterium P01_D01_bin.14]
QDCPYTYMKDMVEGNYRLPWEDEVVYTDGTSCGFETPTREYQGEELPLVSAG